MIKDIEDIRKSARERATRRWNNYRVEREFKAAKKELEAKSTEPKEPQIADAIINEGVRRGSITRAQTKFLRDIRAMMEGHAQRNLLRYALSIRA